MKSIFFNLALIIVSCAFTCSPESNDLQAEDELYKGCCGVEPVEFSRGDSHIYIPNVFTPDAKESNRVFRPYINGSVVDVQAFTILSAKGDTILFQRQSFNFKNEASDAWNGTWPDGSLYTGLFRYKMLVFNKKKELVQIAGSACVVRCGPKAAGFKSKNNCFFPSQAGVDGNLDKGKGNNVSGCFE